MPGWILDIPYSRNHISSRLPSHLALHHLITDKLGKAELEEFREDIQEFQPESAIKWLEKYFEKIQVIYAFQLMNSAFDGLRG